MFFIVWFVSIVKGCCVVLLLWWLWLVYCLYLCLMRVLMVWIYVGCDLFESAWKFREIGVLLFCWLVMCWRCWSEFVFEWFCWIREWLCWKCYVKSFKNIFWKGVCWRIFILMLLINVELFCLGFVVFFVVFLCFEIGWWCSGRWLWLWLSGFCGVEDEWFDGGWLFFLIGVLVIERFLMFCLNWFVFDLICYVDVGFYFGCSGGVFV